jgi:predicted PurR-regulated permease PerM
MLASTLTAALADAIAYAEGFYVTGSRPARNNNPGDLTVDLTGAGIGWDGTFVIYRTIADGWNALTKQVQMMIDGTSAYYNPSMTIQEIANKYTATQSFAWASNVASKLGVSVNTTLNELLATGATLTAGTVVLFAVLIVFLFRKKG